MERNRLVCAFLYLLFVGLLVFQKSNVCPTSQYTCNLVHPHNTHVILNGGMDLTMGLLHGRLLELPYTNRNWTALSLYIELKG